MNKVTCKNYFPNNCSNVNIFLVEWNWSKMFQFEITSRKGSDKHSPHTNLNKLFPPAPTQMGGQDLWT